MAYSPGKLWPSFQLLPADDLAACERCVRHDNARLLTELGHEHGAAPDWLILNAALLNLQSELRLERGLGSAGGQVQAAEGGASC